MSTQSQIVRYFRTTLLAACFAAVAVLIPATAEAAPLPIVKSTYKLTFPDGWMAMPYTISDTMTMVVNDSLDAGGWAYGIQYESEIQVAYLINAMTLAYTSEFVRTDSSQKQIGAHLFTTTGWKDTTADDSTSRVRIYAVSKGNYMFVAWVVYDSQYPAALTEFESALASLEITASASIRRVFTLNRRPENAPRLDILGRKWAAGRQAPAIPLFIRR